MRKEVRELVIKLYNSKLQENINLADNILDNTEDLSPEDLKDLWRYFKNLTYKGPYGFSLQLSKWGHTSAQCHNLQRNNALKLIKIRKRDHMKRR